MYFLFSVVLIVIFLIVVVYNYSLYKREYFFSSFSVDIINEKLFIRI